MYLHEFIKTYIAKNTLVRLWKPIDSEKIYEDKVMLTDEAVMEWEVMDIPQLQDIPVIHITDIVCDTEKEAVNIVVDTDYEPEDVISMIDEYRKTKHKEDKEETIEKVLDENQRNMMDGFAKMMSPVFGENNCRKWYKDFLEQDKSVLDKHKKDRD